MEATRSIVVEDVQGTVFLLLPKESAMPHTMTTEAADLDQDLDSDAGVASSDCSTDTSSTRTGLHRCQVPL